MRWFGVCRGGMWEVVYGRTRVRVSPAVISKEFSVRRNAPKNRLRFGSERRLHSNGVAARKDPRGFGVFRVSPAGMFSSVFAVILQILARDGCAGEGECGIICGEFCWAGCAFARRRSMAAWIFQRGASHTAAPPVEGGLQ